MLQRASVCVLAAVMFGTALPVAAQSENFADRERELARQLMEEQRAAAQRENELARELVAQQRELDAQYVERQHEFAVQQAEQQREMERAIAAQERAQIAQQREFAEETERASRELASELARAKAQLSVSAAEIARLSAELSGGAMNNGLSRLSVFGPRSVLGINIEDARNGVRVAGVSPSGPAAAAGVRAGDIIVGINGFELGNGAGTAAFLERMADVEAGEDVELRILRGGNSRQIVVEATESSPTPFRFESYAGNPIVVGPGNFVRWFRGPWNDIELVSLTPALGEYFGTESGLLVVRAGSMAELGLRDGDVILEIGARQPQSPEHATRIFSSFEPGESVPLSVMRQRRRETVTIAVPAESREAFPYGRGFERFQRFERLEPREPAEPAQRPERAEL